MFLRCHARMEIQRPRPCGERFLLTTGLGSSRFLWPHCPIGRKPGDQILVSQNPTEPTGVKFTEQCLHKATFMAHLEQEKLFGRLSKRSLYTSMLDPGEIGCRVGVSLKVAISGCFWFLAMVLRCLKGFQTCMFSQTDSTRNIRILSLQSQE